MRSNKIIVILTLLIIVLSVLLVVLYHVCLNFHFDLLLEISITIFGSSLLAFIISIIEYFDQRRKTLETLLIELNKYSIAIKKLRPFKMKEPKGLVIAALQEENLNEFHSTFNLEIELNAKNNLLEYFKSHVNSDVNDLAQYEEYFEKRYIDSMNSYHEEYVKAKKSIYEISEFDLSILSKSYAEIDFLFNNNKNRSWIYNDIYEKILYLHRKILELKLHLINSDESNNPNISAIYELLFEFYGTVFRCESETIDKMSFILFYNDFVYGLDCSWEKLRAITYFRKISPIINNPVLQISKIEYSDKGLEGVI